MRFQIFSGETLIGQSDLDRLDSSMGIAFGDFLPAENYKSVQPIFRLYVEATINVPDCNLDMLQRYYQERDDLDLTVRLSGAEIVPVECVHIEDFSAELDEMQITTVASSAEAFSRYFEEQETMC